MKEAKPSWFYLLLLILSGEAIFILPFVLPRVFRPTVLDVLELDNVQLGLCFSVYGLVAMVSYLVGGPLADKYQPRKLIAIALWMTALGGFLFAQYPALWVLQILYGWWGFTTIFLFWAPMIKATRIWGGAKSQGKAFGFLDGGRGLTGGLFSLLGVVVFSLFLASSADEASLEDRKEAFTYVLYLTSIIVILIGVLVWFFMKSDETNKKVTLEHISWAEIKQVLKLPSVWLLMVIILCGYVGYKITDIISQYAEEVMLYNQVDSAKVGTLLQFLRPTMGILVGLIADRLKITWLLVFSFVVTLVGGILFASGAIAPTTTFLFFMSVVVIAAGVYATRALYFGVMQVGKIPLVLTGTAVGLISLIGYTPDVFAGPAYGMLLDAHPGEEIGHQHVFWMLSAFAFIGGLASMIYHKWYGNQNDLDSD